MNLTVEHVLMFVLVFCAFYYLMKGCGCKEGMKTSNPEQCKNIISQYFNDSRGLGRGEFSVFADKHVAAGSRDEMMDMIYDAKQELEENCQTYTEVGDTNNCKDEACYVASTLDDQLIIYNQEEDEN